MEHKPKFKSELKHLKEEIENLCDIGLDIKFLAMRPKT